MTHQNVVNGSKIARIRALNDQLRQNFTGGKVMLTSGVAALPDATRFKLLHAIQNFQDFNEGNNPHGENDMCFVEVDGEKYWAKIDTYDTDMRYLSDDPSDPKITKRIMVIGHQSEY